MKIDVKLEQKGNLKEREVREHIERATARAKQLEYSRSGREVSTDSVREKMVQNAERDKRDGKI